MYSNLVSVVRAALTLSMVNSGAWVAAFISASRLLSQSECRFAYGTLCGWWFAAYVNSYLKSPSAIHIALAILITGVAYPAFLLLTSQHYHDPPTTLSTDWFLLQISGTLFLSSPIIANVLFRRCFLAAETTWARIASKRGRNLGSSKPIDPDGL